MSTPPTAAAATPASTASPPVSINGLAARQLPAAFDHISAGVPPAVLSTARQVYWELTHVQQWLDVEVHTSTPLSMIYMVGRAGSGRAREVILPTAASSVLSMTTLGRYFTDVVEAHVDKQGEDGVARDVLVVAIVDADSTCATYRMFKGLRSPPATAMSGAGDNDHDDA
eukprot:m.63579 g.63579  ORF g.63579 m.63579 type:complete len:170 (-) comp8161_c1_seq1:169-678(-)